MTKYKYESHADRIKGETSSKIKIANRRILEAIQKESRAKTPFKGGDLRGQVSKRISGNEGIITWEVPYAQYQERGKRANPPYHTVQHYTTAGTGKEFAKNAVKKVMSGDLKKYWK